MNRPDTKHVIEVLAEGSVRGLSGRCRENIRNERDGFFTNCDLPGTLSVPPTVQGGHILEITHDGTNSTEKRWRVDESTSLVPEGRQEILAEMLDGRLVAHAQS